MSGFSTFYRLSMKLRFFKIIPLLLLASCTAPIRLHFVTKNIEIRSPAFLRTMSGISAMPILSGNRIREINTGHESFEFLYRLIENAKKSINIEIYIYNDDEVGRYITKLLTEKVSQGVSVNLLVDGMGGREMGDELVEILSESGVNIQFHNPIGFTELNSINQRTHRKLIIIDGVIGMTGGFGFSQSWDTMGDEKERFRDFQVVVEGPVVAQMQSIFLQNWLEKTGQLLIGDDYFPHLEQAGNTKSRMIHSSPYRGSSSVQHVYLFSLNSSRDYFWMENSYFIPDRISLKSLTDAAKRGVDVRLILASPETSDVEVTVHAGRNYYKKLLKAGVHICEYKKQILHSKFAVADDMWSTVGSTNFDNRSFKLNMEANLNVYDRSFALRLKNIFQSDLNDCNAINLESFEKRTIWEHFKEYISGHFESLM